MRLEVSFRVLNKNLDVDFSAKDKKLNAEFQCFQRITEQGDVDYYDGSYTVTPKVEEVRAYGENDTFGVWSEKKEVSGVDSTGGVEVHTVDIPYQGKTERSYFYAQN